MGVSAMGGDGSAGGSIRGAFLGGGGYFEGIGDGGCIGLEGGAYDIEDDHLVFAFFEPAAGDIEGLLGTNGPETANGMAIDVDLAFAPGFHVEEGITDFVEREVTTVVAASLEKGRGGLRALRQAQGP